MAKSFYKFKKRDPLKANVDWAGIGTKLSNDLEAESVRRQEKRDLIEKNTQETLDSIAKVSENAHLTASEWAFGATDTMASATNTAFQQMKNLEITPREFAKKRQLILNQAKGIKRSIDTYATRRAANDKALADGTVSAQTVWENSRRERAMFSDNSTYYIDPETYIGYIAMKDENGQVITDPDKLINVNTLSIDEDIQRKSINISSEVSSAVKILATNEFFTKAGAKTTSAFLNDDYVGAESNAIESMMTDDVDVAQIVVELNSGVSSDNFTLSKEIADSDPTKILLITGDDGRRVPDVERNLTIGNKTKTVQQWAFDGLQDSVRGAIETKRQDIDRTQARAEGLRQDNVAIDIDRMEDFFSGDQATLTARVEQQTGTNPNIKKVERRENSLVFTYAPEINGTVVTDPKDYQTKTISLVDAEGNQIDRETWITSHAAFITGKPISKKDIADYINREKKTGRVFSDTSSKDTASTYLFDDTSFNASKNQLKEDLTAIDNTVRLSKELIETLNSLHLQTSANRAPNPFVIKQLPGSTTSDPGPLEIFDAVTQKRYIVKPGSQELGNALEEILESRRSSSRQAQGGGLQGPNYGTGSSINTGDGSGFGTGQNARGEIVNAPQTKFGPPAEGTGELD